MTLEVALIHRLGAFELDAVFRADGGVTALFGPSGAGKTTIVRAVAGLIRPTRGRIAVGGVVLVDTERRIFVPAHRRRIGVVFQDALLFPHLSVKSNLLYGVRGTGKASFDRIVELLGIAPLLSRHPATLSGGETQRVAIGRALLSEPRLLLLDEPLASLDEQRKQEILPHLERLAGASDVPILYVSHAFAEVARLADTLVLIDRGRITESGPLREVAAGAALWNVAGHAEAGVVLDMTVAEHEADYGLTVLRSPAGHLRVELLDAPIGRAVRVRIPSRDVMIATERPEGLSALNMLEGRVATIGLAVGASQDVGVNCGGAIVVARLTRRSVTRLGLQPGLPVHAIIKSVALEQSAGGRGS